MPANTVTNAAAIHALAVGAVVLLGAPGAGKGTQAKLIAGRYGIPQVSTGDILRGNVARGTALGKKAGPIMKAGGLVPDEVMLPMVADRVGQPECARGFVLDGFPRTVGQAAWLDQYLSSRTLAGRPVRPVVIGIEVSYNQLLQRLTGRRSCPVDGKIYNIYFQPPKTEGHCDACGSELVQRKDDTEAVISERLKNYERQTLPLVDYYRKQARLHKINGDRPVDEVNRDVFRLIENPDAQAGD